MLVKNFGRGPTRVLIFVNKQGSKELLPFFEGLVQKFTLIQIDIFIKGGFEDFERFINLRGSNLYTLLLDLSFDDKKIAGCGSRFRQIFARVGARDNLPVFKDEISNWYCANYEFSSLRVGTARGDFQRIIESVLKYLNGK